MGRTTFYMLEQERKRKAKENKTENHKIVGFTELNAKQSQKAIKNIDDIERLKKLLEIELENDNRKTVIKPLEEKIDELQKEE